MPALSTLPVAAVTTATHLALIMPSPAYLVHNGVPFVAPIHPGDAPVHAQGATGPAITETNSRFKHDLSKHLLYQTVSEELKQRIWLQCLLGTFPSSKMSATDTLTSPS